MPVPAQVGMTQQATGASVDLTKSHANVGERQLAAATATRNAVLLGTGARIGAANSITPQNRQSLVGDIPGLPNTAASPELLFQTELMNLGAEIEASGLLDYARGEGMAGPCGWGGGATSPIEERFPELLDPANLPGKTGYVGSRVNSIWAAINRSLFRARLYGQTSDQSTPEIDDPLFRDSRSLPRALSLRKLRKQ